jgi:hypothetical protein
VWERDKSSFSDHVRNGSCVSAAAIPTSGRVSEEGRVFFRDFVTFFDKFALSLGDL